MNFRFTTNLRLMEPPQIEFKSLVKGYLPTIFRDVKEGWKKILFSPEIKPTINKCFKDLDIYLKLRGVTQRDIELRGLGHYIRPRPELIFECFRYFEPDKLKLIILGQDPYPKIEDASGLCFSTLNSKLPKSIENIYKCLHKQQLIQTIPKTGDLTPWAKQGVLLLNRYLTRSPNFINGTDGNRTEEFLHPFWADFTTELIRYISTIYCNEAPKQQERKRYLGFFLWGRVAQEVTLFIDPNPKYATVEIFEWTHPVGITKEDNDKHFIHCDNFARINQSLKNANFEPINWDTQDCSPILNNSQSLKDNNEYIETLLISEDTTTNHEKNIVPNTKDPIQINNQLNPIVAAVDGGCIGNGTAKSRASYAVYFPQSFNQKNNGISEKQIVGIVSSLELKLHNNKLIEIPSEIYPTNGRAELLALIHALLHIIENIKHPCPIIIIEDAAYGIHLINYRIWKYMAADYDLITVNKNRDLILIIRDLLFNLAKSLSSLISDKEDITNIWHTLIQPKCRQDKKIEDPDLNWNGLIMVHQESHLPKTSINRLHGIELEKCQLNMHVDQLAQNYLKP